MNKKYYILIIVSVLIIFGVICFVYNNKSGKGEENIKSVQEDESQEQLGTSPNPVNSITGLLKNEPNEKDGNYSITSGVLYYEKTVIDDADLDTFQVLDDYYAKDKQVVYLAGKPIEIVPKDVDLDVNTFELLNSIYAKDKKYVYSLPFDSINTVEVIIGADVDTFEVLEGFYAKDKNRIYWGVEDIEPDIETFQILSGGYSKDKKYVYCYLYPVCNKIISEADLNTFEIINDEYTKDKNNVYDFGEVKKGIKPVNCTKENLSGCK